MKKTVKYKNIASINNQELDFKNTVAVDKQTYSFRSQKLMGSPVSSLLEKEILGEVKKANKLLEEIARNFQGSDEGNSVTKLNQFRIMEEEIRKKQLSIKNIQLDIKELQKGYVQPDVQNFKNELKEPCHQLQNILKKYHKKIQNLNKQKQKTDKLQAKYISKCLKLGIEAISYEDFCKYRHRKSIGNSIEITNGKIRSQNRVKASTNKDLKEKNYNLLSNESSKNKGTQVKRLQEVFNQRDVMEAALKAAKKKHLTQINQYRSKLEFLKGEHQDLSSKVQAKMEQLQNFEKKFKDFRGISKSRSKEKERSQRLFKFRTQLRS